MFVRNNGRGGKGRRSWAADGDEKWENVHVVTRREILDLRKGWADRRTSWICTVEIGGLAWVCVGVVCCMLAVVDIRSFLERPQGRMMVFRNSIVAPVVVLGQVAEVNDGGREEKIVGVVSR